MFRALSKAVPMIVLAGSILTSPALAAEQELEGTYLAKGVNAGGSEYDALVEIVRHRDVFILMTMVPDRSGEEMQVRLVSMGIGVVNGGVLAVSEFGPEMTRIVSYRVEDGGRRLVGRWTSVDGDGTVCDETLTRLPDTPKPSKNDRPERRDLHRVVPDA